MTCDDSLPASNCLCILVWREMVFLKKKKNASVVDRNCENGGVKTVSKTLSIHVDGVLVLAFRLVYIL